MLFIKNLQSVTVFCLDNTLPKGSVLPEKSCFCSFLLFLDQSYDMISYKRSKRKAPAELEAKLELANLSHKTLPILTTKLRIF